MAANLEPEIIDLTGLTDSSEEEEDDDSERPSDEESSGEDGDEFVVDESTRAQLFTALSTVTESRLRLIVRNLIETVPAVEMALTRELVTLKRKTQDVVSRWETCSNCDVEFDVGEEREDGECVFHPGELEVNEASFLDWDENCHGPMDTSANRRDYPENFQWTCCDKDGLSEGCVQGEHRSPKQLKRRRI